MHVIGARILGAIAPLSMLLATGCSDETAIDRSGDQGGDAAGEVLGGTISDDMLPLESLRSQSPPEALSTGAPNADTSDTTDDAADENSTSEPDEADAATVAPASPSDPDE